MGLSVATAVGSRAHTVEALLGLATVHRRLGEPDAAQANAERALAEATASVLAVRAAQAHAILAELDLDRGNREAATAQARHARRAESPADTTVSDRSPDVVRGDGPATGRTATGDQLGLKPRAEAAASRLSGLICLKFSSTSAGMKRADRRGRSGRRAPSCPRRLPSGTTPDSGTCHHQPR
jgi:hypothetical protein